MECGHDICLDLEADKCMMISRPDPHLIEYICEVIPDVTPNQVADILRIANCSLCALSTENLRKTTGSLRVWAPCVRHSNLKKTLNRD